MFDMGGRVSRDKWADGGIGDPVGKVAPQDPIATQSLPRHDEETGFIPVRRAHDGLVQGRTRRRLCHIMQVDFRIDLNSSATDAFILINVERFRNGFRGFRFTCWNAEHIGEVFARRQRFGAALALGSTSRRNRLRDMFPDLSLTRF